jgi:hypothetical protein
MMTQNIGPTSGEAERLARVKARDVEAAALSNLDCGLPVQRTWSHDGVVLRCAAAVRQLLGLAR